MGGMAGMGAMGGMVGMSRGYMESTSTMGGRGYNGMEMHSMNSVRNNGAWAAREMGGDFDGMAAPDMFLNEYYSQVCVFFYTSTQPTIVILHIYRFSNDMFYSLTEKPGCG